MYKSLDRYHANEKEAEAILKGKANRYQNGENDGRYLV